jgi:hypothetical protein
MIVAQSDKLAKRAQWVSCGHIHILMLHIMKAEEVSLRRTADHFLPLIHAHPAAIRLHNPADRFWTLRHHIRQATQTLDLDLHAITGLQPRLFAARHAIRGAG